MIPIPMPPPPPTDPPQGADMVVIPKEHAVFWMDDQGRWCNRHGPFQHRRIIDHFNRSIRRDEGGYYLTQARDDLIEKVYFRYAETPLFATRFTSAPAPRLYLNTGATVDLSPADLFVRNDQLYQQLKDEHIKFTERALMDIAPLLGETAGGLVIGIGQAVYAIADG